MYDRIIPPVFVHLVNRIFNDFKWIHQFCWNGYFTFQFFLLQTRAFVSRTAFYVTVISMKVLSNSEATSNSISLSFNYYQSSYKCSIFMNALCRAEISILSSSVTNATSYRGNSDNSSAWLSAFDSHINVIITVYWKRSLSFGKKRCDEKLENNLEYMYSLCLELVNLFLWQHVRTRKAIDYQAFQQR